MKRKVVDSLNKCKKDRAFFTNLVKKLSFMNYFPSIFVAIAKILILKTIFAVTRLDESHLCTLWNVRLTIAIY